MIIKQLKLRNIRSYVDETINFPEGRILLSGDIGSGKSTILLAIEFVLFGIKGKELPANAILRNGANEGYVELLMEIDGKQYVIRRNLKRNNTALNSSIKQTAGYVIVDGTRYDFTPVELKNYVLNTLGYPRNLASKTKDLVYRFTVYTAQEQMKNILFNDEERLKTLRRLFQIDKYETIKNNASFVAKLLRDRIRFEEEKVRDFSVLQQELGEYNKELVIKRNQLSDVNKEYEQIVNKANKLKNELKQLEEKKEKFLDMQRELTLLNSAIRDKQKQVDVNCDKIHKLKTEIGDIKAKFEAIVLEKPTDKTIENIDKEINELQLKIENSEKDKIKVEGKIKACNDAIKRLIDELEQYDKVKLDYGNAKEAVVKLKEKLVFLNDIDGDIKQSQDELSKIFASIGKFENKKDESLMLVKKIAQLDNCPMCLQEVKDEHKHKISDEQNKIITECDKKLNELNIAKKQLELKLKELNNKKNEFLKLNENIAVLEESIKSYEDKLNLLESKKEHKLLLENELKELDLEYQKLANINADELRMQLNDLRKLQKKVYEFSNLVNEKKNLKQMYLDKKGLMLELEKSNEVMVKEIAELKQNIEKIAEQLSMLKDVETELLKLKNELDFIEKQEKSVLTRKIQLDKDIESLNRDIKKLEQRIKEYEKIKENIKLLREYENYLSLHVVKITELIEKSVMMKVYNEFNEYFMKWFSMLIEDETINVRLKDDFSPVIEQNGYETTIINLSGGEKTSVALAYRLALNKVVNNLVSGVKTKDILILDEPTDGFSSQQLDKLKDVLDELNLKQVIVVSHEPKLETMVEHIVRIEKNEHISRVFS